MIGVTKDGRPITAETVVDHRRIERLSHFRSQRTHHLSQQLRSNLQRRRVQSRRQRNRIFHSRRQIHGRVNRNHKFSSSSSSSSFSSSSSSSDDDDDLKRGWRQIFRMGGRKLALLPGSGSSSSDSSFHSSESNERNIFRYRRGEVVLFGKNGDARNRRVFNIGRGRLMLGDSSSSSGSSSSQSFSSEEHQIRRH